MPFISAKTFFFVLEYSNFCKFPSSCPKFQDLKKLNMEELRYLNDLHKLPFASFRITQKSL